MKLLVTGASGYLGRVVAARAARRHAVFAGHARRADRVPAGRPVVLDLLRPGAARAAILELAPEAIVHAAAVNPGGSPDAMMAVNGDGTRAVAEAAADLGARLVHVSTDVVHDGRAAPYADDAAPSPMGPYPRSKATGERAVAEALPSAAIVRTSLIYGLEEMDHGTRHFAERLRRGETLELFADVLRQPVWVETLAEALLRLVELGYAGLLNVAGSQVMSREAFGRRMLAFWGVEAAAAKIESVSARELGVEVPLDLSLTLDRARAVLGMPLPGVDEVLAARK